MFARGQVVVCIHKRPWWCLETMRNEAGPAYKEICTVDGYSPFVSGFLFLAGKWDRLLNGARQIFRAALFVPIEDFEDYQKIVADMQGSQPTRVSDESPFVPTPQWK